MSRKIETFKSFIANPLNTHNFLVQIPGFEERNIIVQSTTYPNEQLQTTSLYVAGEQIRYPTIAQVGGTWAVRVPENDYGATREFFDSLVAQMWDQKSGAFYPDSWMDIAVYARDLVDTPVFGVLLHGSWIMGRSQAVQLAANAPTTNWQWDYQFTYNWIEDIKAK